MSAIVDAVPAQPTADAAGAPVAALADSTLFRGLSAAQLARLAACAQRRPCARGEDIFHVGDAADALYVVARGVVEVVSEEPTTGTRHGLIRLHAGAGFGEGSLDDGAVRPISVRAVEDGELLRLTYDALRSLCAQDPALATRLKLNFGEQAVWNFRALSQVAVRSLQERLAVVQAHERSELFVITMLVVLCAYVFVLQVAAQVIEGRFSTSWLSVPGFVVFFLLFWRAARRSGQPIAAYGVTLQGWRGSLAQGLAWSLPVCGLTVLAKWMLVTWHPAMQGEPLFVLPSHLAQPTLALGIEASVYILFAPFQEFIVRGAMQGSLEGFLTGRRRRMKAILVANLMYAMLHLYMSVIFSLMVFLPGLLWGWLYARHRTLVGVTASHALCGLFAFFVVGFDTLIRIYG
jgi:CRP-like cAMP-binding protein